MGGPQILHFMQSVSDSTLGSAPTSFTQIGKTYSAATISQTPSVNTASQIIYSPSTGVSGNFLTPGIYTMSIYAVIYVDSASTFTGGIIMGISSNSSTTPAGGANISGCAISFGINLTSAANGIWTSFPTFTFEVTTSAYYYSFMQTAASITITGSYVLLARTLSIVRVG